MARSWGIQRIEVKLVREQTVLQPEPRLDGSAEVARFLRKLIGDAAQETFVVLHLDARHRLLGVHYASIGSLTSCAVDPASVLRAALASGCCAIAVGHNHPSGNQEPSADDVVLTRRLEQACEVVGVPLVDHVVVGNGYFSFAERGLLKPAEEPIEGRAAGDGSAR